MLRALLSTVPLPIAVVAITVVILTVALVILLLVAMRRLRKRYAEGREPLPDDAFLRDAGAQAADAELFLAIRRAMAELCRLPPEMIRADDNPEELCGLMSTGWDEGGFRMFLEEELPDLQLAEEDRLPCPVLQRFFFWGRKGFPTFGEWARAVVAHLREDGIRTGQTGHGTAADDDRE